MKVKVSQVFEPKEIEGVTKEGRPYKIKIQNVYASYLDGSDVRLSASGISDLKHLEGKTIDLSGAMTSGEYDGKPQIKIGKKTIIKVVEAESKPVESKKEAPVGKEKTESNPENSNRTEQLEKKLVSSTLRIYNDFKTSISQNERQDITHAKLLEISEAIAVHISIEVNRKANR